MREGRVESMNKSYKLESREILLQEMEANTPKVPFAIEQPTGDLSLSKPVALCRQNDARVARATRSMMWMWKGEVSADRQGYRVLATGQNGTFSMPPRYCQELPRRHAPAALRNECQRQGVRTRFGLRDHAVTPLVLAVDTTHESGSLALARGREILEERSLASPSGFAHVIYPEL